ncbi:MAG TPA: hypothetical protein VFB02_16310 [Bradyrhizobium sp.]|nr:hypothetical protein [Bradyrhizobium sp.]
MFDEARRAFEAAMGMTTTDAAMINAARAADAAISKRDGAKHGRAVMAKADGAFRNLPV